MWSVILIFLVILLTLPLRAYSAGGHSITHFKYVSCSKVMTVTAVAPIAAEEWPPQDWKQFFQAHALLNDHPILMKTIEIPAREVSLTPNEEALLYVNYPGKVAPAWVSKRVQERLQDILNQNAPGYLYLGTYSHPDILLDSLDEFQAPSGIRFSVLTSFIENVDQSKGQLLETFNHISQTLSLRTSINPLTVPISNTTWGSDRSIFLKRQEIMKSILAHFELNRDHAHVEMFPVETVGSNLFRYSVITTIEDEKSLTEYHDTVVLPGDRSQLNAILVGSRETLSPRIHYQHITEQVTDPVPTDLYERLAKGKERQISNLQTVLTKVYTDYVRRRKWTKDFIIDLYHHALATLNNTPYVTVWEKIALGKPPKLIGTLGINRVNYGKVRFYNQVTQNWTEVTGSTGGGLQTDFPEFYSASGPERKIENWSAAVPLLGMEQMKDQPLILDRPMVLERMMLPLGDEPSKRRAHGLSLNLNLDFGRETNTLPIERGPDLVPDLSKGVFFYSGQVSEPTKLWLDHDNKKSPLRSIAEQRVFSFIADAAFPSARSPDFNLNGSRFYSFNPTKEWPILYGTRGCERVKAIAPILIDQKPWDVIQISYSGLNEIQLKENEELSKRFLEILLKRVTTP